MENNFDPVIPLSLRRFVSIYIGDHQYRSLPDLLLARLIKVVDSNAEIAHVEMPSPQNKLTSPTIWYAHAWRTESAHIKRMRAYSAKERDILDKRRTALIALMNALMRLTGLGQKEVEPIARRIIIEKRVNEAKIHGVDITSLPERLPNLMPTDWNDPNEDV
jgi:hypothetical protein